MRSGKFTTESTEQTRKLQKRSSKLQKSSEPASSNHSGQPYKICDFPGLKFLWSLLFGAWILASAGCAQTTRPSNDLLYSDDFKDLSDWSVELERGGTVIAKDGKLEIDTPAGCSVWFKHELSGPISIEYDATVIKAGGPNDRVSDLNCFWMATDSRSPGNILNVPRSGRFADYNQLRCYYVGYGGNTNTTTRFRRYIGSPTTRPILPEHDLTDAKFMLQPNMKYHVRLIANGGLIQYWRNGEKIFEYNDPEPYTRGWFAIRTTFNHMTVENLRVRRVAL